MNDDILSSMISRAKVVFDIIEKEYKVFLSRDKREILENITYSNFFKVCEKEDLPPIYLIGNINYLNQNIFKEIPSLRGNDLYSTYLRENNNFNLFNDLVIFMCLSILCGELNPLKLGLIELEIREISNKYNLNISNVNNYKELNIARIVKDKILSDVPFNIIFLDSDIEIFNYLTEEKGIKIAKLYYQISGMMKSKFKGFSNNNFSLSNFINYYNNINYDDVMDLIYDFLNEKIR
ncbi:MAG: hypothetical protein IJ501_04675 [Bacilli bacterium]|nr:hypothetical protein [Bacilli bacterium]